MDSVYTRNFRSGKASVPPLRHGERLTQAEFHRRYEAHPDNTKFELIGGTVYMASPMRLPHGKYHGKLTFAFELYDASTPGLEGTIGATAILGEESEPQPDLILRILPEYGGQSRTNENNYLEGAPELVAEVSDSTRSIDLNQKKLDYQRAGVIEYLVLAVEEEKIHWFHFPSKEMIAANRQGVHRSRVFPGLWLDAPALWQLDSKRIAAAVHKGLASREHAAFVKRLQAAHRRLRTKEGER